MNQSTRRLGMLTGAFNLLWAIVVVLMVYRPGSTTGSGCDSTPASCTPLARQNF